ncbi:class I SAM-dependent methyltransferase [Streptomyces sp. NPDC020412]|uniref:class I SAM-dependent methyltransferase n=1 Tax=Streptomyces sp. NPDC020412 TaxID=3365073 RepID=UPI00378DDB5B
MSEASYAGGVLGHHRPGEAARLALLEATCDPTSRALIDALPLPHDAACAVVGAGNGALVHHLAARFPRGRVTATDIETGLLRAHSWPAHVSVVRHDVTAAELAADAYDLVHARAVLTHLPHPERLVARMARWLTPGTGRLVVEDPTYARLDAEGHPAFAALLWSCAELLRRVHGTDHAWADRVPAALAAAGLTDVTVHRRTAVVGEDPVEDAYWRSCFARATPELITRGLLSAAQIARGVACMDRPDFRHPTWTVVSCSARRP